jgi:methylmalonyl-CoA/ethylmalonyl-CoA epimerase
MPKGNVHHLGIAVASIVNTVQSYAESLKAEWDGEIIHDPNQDVRVTFLASRNNADPLTELVEPVGDSSPVMSFVKRGGGLHHVCYLTDCLQKELEDARTRGSLVVRPPLPAVAFGGRRIAWVYTTNKLLIEYLER